jgi:hypothetical protein
MQGQLRRTGGFLQGPGRPGGAFAPLAVVAPPRSLAAASRVVRLRGNSASRCPSEEQAKPVIREPTSERGTSEAKAKPVIREER